MTKDEALKLALKALGAYMSATDSEEDAKAHRLMAEAFFKIKEALNGCQCQECQTALHASDCAVHSGPAYPKGECNCGAQQYNVTSDHKLMENAQGDLESIKLVQTGVGISKPEQEPVAWKLVPIKPTDEMLKAMDECSTEGYDERLYAGHAASVYMAAVDVAPSPPQRKPLTDDEIWKNDNIMSANSGYGADFETLRQVIRAIEAAHGIKENT